MGLKELVTGLTSRYFNQDQIDNSAISHCWLCITRNTLLHPQEESEVLNFLAISSLDTLGRERRICIVQSEAGGKYWHNCLAKRPEDVDDCLQARLKDFCKSRYVLDRFLSGRLLF